MISSTKECCEPGGVQTCNLLITSWTRIQLSHRGRRWYLYPACKEFKSSFWYNFGYSFQESPSVIHVEIDRRLEEDGLSTDCSHEEKLLYIWRLYQNAEVRTCFPISNSLDNLHNATWGIFFYWKVLIFFLLLHENVSYGYFSGSCGFDPQTNHTKDFKNGTCCSFAWRSALIKEVELGIRTG